ncbi:hypothetical protein GCM10027416_00510 [Okibacterium endophyticum]
MSSTSRPAGTLPKSVYRRRRLWVLLGLLAVIAIIVLIVWRPGSSSGSDGAATPRASTSPTATDAPPADGAVTDESGESPDAPAEGVAECSSESLVVEAKTDKNTYAAGENPQLSLTITNTADAPCSVNVGTSQQVFTITSGDETYWVSTDCQTAPADAVVELAAGQSVSSATPIVWDRTRSSTDTCDGERPAVPAGGASYHLTTALGGIESDATAQFLLY